MIVELLKENNVGLNSLLEECFSKKVENIDIEDALSKNVRFMVAKEDDEIVGSIMITTKYNPVRNTKEFYLDYVCVKESERGKGTGKNLLKEVEKLAKEEGVSRIEFTSSTCRIAARNLYISNGYIIRDTNMFYKDMVI